MTTTLKVMVPTTPLGETNPPGDVSVPKSRWRPATRADATDTTTCEVADRNLSIELMSARPIRPLPSVNGRIDSNWACAAAA